MSLPRMSGMCWLQSASENNRWNKWELLPFFFFKKKKTNETELLSLLSHADGIRC